MSRGCALVFVSLFIAFNVATSNTYLYEAEAEASVVCYTRYPEVTQIWNALMMTLPSRHMIDPALLGRDLSFLRTLLGSGVKPCEAVARVLLLASRSKQVAHDFRASCSLSAQRISPDAPSLSCLHATHLVGLVASLQSPIEAEARAMFVRAAALSGGLSGEETLTYDGTFKTNLTRTVVEAAVAGERRKRKRGY